jgi:phage host-nuclease inhibitor protein Gam
MRTSEPYKVRVHHINSLSDLEREKERLQTEITRKEEGIKYNYQNLVQLLSFRNLIGTLIDEVSSTTTVVGKLFTLGKDFVAKRKKKKKEKHSLHQQHEPLAVKQAE